MAGDYLTSFQRFSRFEWLKILILCVGKEDWRRNGGATTSEERGERKTFLRESMRAELGLGILGKIFIF